MVEFRDDGTIVMQYRKRVQREDGVWVSGDDIVDVTLRRPELTELYDLWESLERLAPAEQAAEPVEGEPAANGAARLKTTRETLQRNAGWNRGAIALLAAPAPYTQNDDGEWEVISDLSEPSWLVSGLLSGQMLRHWQTVPLALGS